MSSNHFRLLFVTKSDLTGREGHNITSRNMAIAFSRCDAVDTTIVCPEPASEYPASFDGTVDRLDHFVSRSLEPSIGERIWSVFDVARVLRNTVLRDDPDAMVARLAPDMLAPPLIARRYDLSYIALARGNSHRRLKVSWLLTRLFWFNVRTATEVYAASQEIVADANRGRCSDQRPARLLPNAVDAKKFQPEPIDKAREAIGFDADADFVVGFVGSMKPRHRVDVLLRAVGRLDDPDKVRVLLIGEGPELEHFRSVADEVGVADVVCFAGFIPHDSVSTYLSACDVLYAVRSQSSATPVKVFEYLACERPVLVREMDELEFVTKHNLGRTVSEPDPDSVANAIAELRALGHDERQAMGRRGREFVEREHTWDAFARTIVDDLLA